MRVLTVRQPWAWALIHGGKDPENRGRNIAGDYRGPVAIHAGLTDAGADAWTAVDWHARYDPPEPNDVVRGAIIGVVNLWAVHEAAPACCPNRGALPFGSPWAMAEHWHLCVTNPRPLAEPIPAKGRLGLWRPGDELEATIREQVLA